MRKVKIIGSGRVVKNLLDNYRESLKGFEIEIYSNESRLISDDFEAKGIEAFKSSNDIVILCSSVNERDLLKDQSSKSRNNVFEKNIDHINAYLRRGCFEKGKIFILTNPSELIAEYIFKKTANKNIFALGQEVDIKRYKKHIGMKKEVKCLGQHFQYPIIQKVKNISGQFELRKKLIEQVKSEFVDNSPPFESGTYNIVRLLRSLEENDKAMVSSYCATNDSFLCGRLNTRSGEFRVNKPTTIKEMVFMKKQVNASKEMIMRYL